MEVVRNRQLAQDSFLTNLRKAKTPSKIITCIQHGLTEWEVLGQDSLLMPAPNRGLLTPVDIALTQAFRDHTQNIG